MLNVPSQFVIFLTLLTTILSNFTYFKLLLIIYCQMYKIYVLRIVYNNKIMLSCLLIIVLLL